MLDGLDTGINEFNNYGFDTNIAKFVNYHTKTTDISINVQTSIKSIAAFDTFRERHILQPSHRLNLSLNESYEEPRTEPAKNYSMSCIDKNLTSIPHEIMQKQYLLTVLDLSRNKFEQLPLEILFIKPLRVLKMDHNRIKFLPPEIVKLTNLEALSLSHNLLQRLPPNLGRLPHFQDLNVEANIIDNVAKELASFKNLKCLNILQNRLTILPCSFRELFSIQELHFEWFKYANPPLDAYQRGKEGEYNLKKLKNKLNELYHKDINGLTFQDFITLFSKQSVVLNVPVSQKQALFHQACLNEDINIMKLLLRDNPELLESRDQEGLTPLCFSLLKDKGKSVYHLIRTGANIFTAGTCHGSPIHIAAKRLNYGAIKDIIRLGEDPNRIDGKGNTPLHYAMMVTTEVTNKTGLLLQHLLEQGANQNAKNKENWAPIHLAVRRRDCKTLKWVLSYNFEVKEIHGRDEDFDINKRGGGYRWTPMHIAAYGDAPEIIETLGEAGADVFKKSANGYTPKMVTKKNGVALKLLEKYEKQWIKKNILFKRDMKQESLSSFNLKNLNNTKEIKNASKNKFGEVSFRHSENPSMNRLRTKLEFFAPLKGSGLIFQHSEYDNSIDISPETETVSSVDDTETAYDMCSEISENIKVETNLYATDLPFCRKPSNPGQSQNQILSHPSLKEKNSRNIFNDLDFDIQTRFAALKTDYNFSLEACAREVAALKELVLSDKISACDKIKVLFGLKALYFKIVDHVFDHFYGLGDKKSFFPWYILQESVRRARDQDKFRLKNCSILEIITYYEIVPQSLISLFIKLDPLAFENQVLKIYILNILTDLKYFPAIDLLNSVIENSTECFLTVKEAQKANAYLQTLLHNSPIKSQEDRRSSKRIFRDREPPAIQMRVENFEIKRKMS